MIITDITGRTTGEADGMLALIKLVSEPDAYREKVKALVEATEEHKRFVALVGPADDVLTLREAAKADREAAKKELADSQIAADAARTNARKAAMEIVQKATEDRNEMLAKASAVVSDAKAKWDEVSRAQSAAAEAHQKALATQQAAAQKAEQYATATQMLDAERAEVQGLRDALRKKLAQIAQAADL